MADSGFDFSYDMQGVDRTTLLQEAAQTINALGGHLDDSGRQAPETPEAALILDLAKDVAKLGEFPEIYKITGKNFLANNRAIPASFTSLTKQFNYYWLHIPIGLMPRRNWAFDRLELKVIFEGGDQPHLTPKAYQIMPAKQYETLMQANQSLRLGLNEKLEFSIETPTLTGAVGAAQVRLAPGSGL